MLYISFRATVMVAAILGLMHMIAEGSFIYMFFPIAIIIWAIYSFFDENDREYLYRNGIDPDEISWFFPDYADYGAVHSKASSMNQTTSSHRRSYPARNYNYENNDNSRYCPQNTYYTPYYSYNNPIYSALKDKCKRNFKITIAKEKNDTEEN